MAITTRFFSTTGAGAADGTTWADRAALFSGGNWSSVISGFDFSSGSLKALIGPGTYTCSQSLTTTVITTDPTNANPLFLCGCDSSGVLLAIPDPDWMSCQPAWDSSGIPLIQSSSNVAIIACGNVFLLLLAFSSSGRTSGGVLSTSSAVSWCQVTNSASNASALAFEMSGFNRTFGCVFKCTGSTHSAVVDGGTSNMEMINCRIEGVAGSSGNRNGVTGSAAFGILSGCTIVNCGGNGLNMTVSSAAATWRVYHCTVANNAADGLKCNSTASQSDVLHTQQCMITGNGGFGINPNSDAGRWWIEGNRLRDNTSNNFGSAGNYPTDLDNYTTDSDDATEYVSTGANGDFRIKNTATIWGQGYGAGEQPPATPIGQSMGMM